MSKAESQDCFPKKGEFNEEGFRFGAGSLPDAGVDGCRL